MNDNDKNDKRHDNINQLFARYKQKRGKKYIPRLGVSKEMLSPSYDKTLAIIVPYRDNPEQDRKSQLERFTEHVKKVFKGKKWKLYVIEQSDDGQKFNRGKLLNIGMKLALKDGCELLATHDVDLLPQPDIVPFYYLYSKFHPVHLGHVWQDKYRYWEFIGGILLMSDFIAQKVNGYPNNFWGWGGEDDALYDRILTFKIQIYEPTDGSVEELKHVNTSEIKKYVNHKKKQNILKDLLHWKENGMNNLKYKLLSKEGDKYTVEI